MNKPWYLYIAQAKTGRLYTGITTDPEKRLIRHNSGQGSRFAKQQGPFILAYVSDPIASKSLARQREIQIKTWSQVKKQKLINGEWI
ncbi:MAG: GIY-YIG nuclease family protein [Patescibacteria group bacterium]